MINEVLSNAEDIAVIGKATDKDKYVFAVKPGVDFKRKQFKMTIANPSEEAVDAFNRNDRHWEFDERTQEIKGSSTFLGLRFDKQLRPFGLWVPGVLEARVLEAKNKLTNGVYRDNGMVVYSAGEPNKEIANALAERAEKEGWELPILASFRDLDYQINPNAKSYGVNVFFVGNPKGLIKGKEAVKVLNQFDFKGNKGAVRSLRLRSDGWYAGNGSLAGSNADGRVGDWICGEAARAELEEAYASLSERQYGSKIRELETARDEQRKAFSAELGAK